LSDISVLAGVLEELSKATSKRFDAGSFESRLRIQKSVYLLEALGVKEMKNYGFSYYVRGPYSPSLAKDYYALEEKSIAPRRIAIPTRSMNVVKECVDRGDAFLEAVSTLHSIATLRNSNRRDVVVEIARSLKPQLWHKYDDAWEFLMAAGLL